MRKKKKERKLQGRVEEHGNLQIARTPPVDEFAEEISDLAEDEKQAIAEVRG